MVRERLRIHQPHSLHSISVVQGKGEADTSDTDDGAGVAGVMLHATGDRLMDSDSGFYLRVYSRSLSHECVYSRKASEV